MNEAIKQTLLARVYDVAVETSLELARKLTAQIGGNIYLKREDLQSVHSFKLRGAYNKIAQLTPEERARGVIAASAGNHAQGVALSAQKLGISALIVMPCTTPAIKVEAVKSYGADVELVGDSYSDAAEHCMQRIKETGRTYIHPFDDPLVIAGQGTIGREILEQLPQVTHIFVPVGGGGLIAGIGQYLKAIRPDIRIIAVEPEDSNVLQASLAANKRIVLPHVGIFADGVAVKQMGVNTFRICREVVDECITVSTDELCAAMKAIFEETRSIVEGAGGLGVAGIQQYAATHDMTNVHAVAICSGANIAFERLQFVAERTLLGSGNEALFAVTLPEQAGALQRFCETVVNGHNITQFGYRLNRRGTTTVFVGVSIGGQTAAAQFTRRMETRGYTYTDLSGEDTAKEHIRHMIGGPAPEARDEHFYRVNFPERPGALNDFLKATAERWNISLLHYRGQGANEGNVLVGFEAADTAALEKALKRTGYDYENVDRAQSITLFV
jgi:threonine dehydratase